MESIIPKPLLKSSYIRSKSLLPDSAWGKRFHQIKFSWILGHPQEDICNNNIKWLEITEGGHPPTWPPGALLSTQVLHFFPCNSDLRNMPTWWGSLMTQGQSHSLHESCGMRCSRKVLQSLKPCHLGPESRVKETPPGTIFLIPQQTPFQRQLIRARLNA